MAQAKDRAFIIDLRYEEHAAPLTRHVHVCGRAQLFPAAICAMRCEDDLALWRSIYTLVIQYRQPRNHIKVGTNLLLVLSASGALFRLRTRRLNGWHGLSSNREVQCARAVRYVANPEVADDGIAAKARKIQRFAGYGSLCPIRLPTKEASLPSMRPSTVTSARKFFNVAF